MKGLACRQNPNHRTLRIFNSRYVGEFSCLVVPRWRSDAGHCFEAPLTDIIALLMLFWGICFALLGFLIKL